MFFSNFSNVSTPLGNSNSMGQVLAIETDENQRMMTRDGLQKPIGGRQFVPVVNINKEGTLANKGE